MTKKVMLIYRIIILIPYVNLISFFLMGDSSDILFDNNSDEEDIRRYYKTGAFTAGNGSGVEGSEYHLRCNNKRRGRISRGRYFVYLLCRSGGRHRVLHKLGADSKAKRENTV